MVIAIRGTIFTYISNLITDGAWASDDVNTIIPGTNGATLRDYFDDAAKFLISVETMDNGKYETANIQITGHSLGGALAQLLGEAANIGVTAFDAPGAQGFYQSLLADLKHDDPTTYNALIALPSQSQASQTDTNYRLYGDPISTVDHPNGDIGQRITLANPSPNPGDLPPLDNHSMSTLDLQVKGYLHNPQLVQSVPEGTDEPNNWASTILPIQDAKGAVGVIKDFLLTTSWLSWIDPSGNADFVYTQDQNSPAITSVDLPALTGVESYELRYETGTTWSTFRQVWPEEWFALPAGVVSVEFAPLDSSGNTMAAPDSVMFGLLFAGTGTLNATVSSSEQIPGPVNLALSSGSDSGIQGDDITNVTTPVITGTGEVGDTVALFDGATSVGTGTVATDGTWSITTGLLAPGLQTLTATETDLAANVSAASSALALTLDTMPPTTTAVSLTVAGNSAATAIGITAPTDNLDVASALTIKVAALPTDGTVLLSDGITAVSLNQVLTATQLTGLQFKPTANLFGQRSTLSYRVVDVAGNSTTGSATLAINTTTPTVLVVTPNPLTGELGVGQVVLIRLGMSASVTVSGGTPTLTLNDGGTATYDSVNSTSSILVFKYTVAANQNTTALAITNTPNLNGATVKDSNGTSADLSGAIATVLLSDGTTAVALNQALTATQLIGLKFKSTAKLFGQTSTFSYTVADVAGNSTTGSATLAIKTSPPLPNHFNSDGKSVLWQNDSGEAYIWLINGTNSVGGGSLGNPGATWHIEGTGDFNDDGQTDILWQNDNGQADIWLMNGTTPTVQSFVGANPGSTWHIKTTADLNGDGKSDVLWQNDSGEAYIWLIDGTNIVGSGSLGNPGATWHIEGTGDFNHDGQTDILAER